MTLSSKSHQGKEQEEGRNAENREKIKQKLSEVNTKPVSRGQNALIDEFKVM